MVVITDDATIECVIGRITGHRERLGVVWCESSPHRFAEETLQTIALGRVRNPPPLPPTMMATHTVISKNTVALNTEWRFWADIPCERRMRRAYKDPADEEITSGNVFLHGEVSVTPSNFKLDTRGISGIKGTSHTERLRGLTKTISLDFFRFNWRLFATDHVYTLSSSWPQLSTLQPGIMRSKSSANSTICLLSVH